MTPHNEAKKGDIAKTVLMPGDPLRAKYIAEKFLEKPILINTIRNMYAYTGKYKGKRITVFASGMGIPSMGIYCYELFKFYDVENIIRIGSSGAYVSNLNLLDTILVEKSFSASAFALELTGKENHIANSSSELNQIILDTSKELNEEIVVGNAMCSEVFSPYCDFNKLKKLAPKDLHVITGEMEAFALFTTAQLLNKKASCLLTVVDSHYKEGKISAKARENSLNNMILLALESAVRI